MTNLKDVNVGHNKFCGPAVLSILTGRSTDECANVISSINGQYNVRGVLLTDLLKAAERLGFEATSVTPGNTLFTTLTRIVHTDGIYIVTVTGHFVCIEVKEKQIFFCDNHTKVPIPAASSARLGMAVVDVHIITKKPKPPKVPEKYRIVTMYECEYCRARGMYQENIIHAMSCAYRLGLDNEN